MTISWDDFLQVDIRVGEIVKVEDFPEARKPAYKISVNFGDELGVKTSSAQATNYSKTELLGMQVACVVNFPAKRIASVVSEVLILGVPGEDNQVSLLTPSKKALLNGRAY
ncbi:MAG: tRNA-binding protein [Proteobacteria bacterium]|nr:tRNA-binding protein [Pseudomonadota bacterium]